MIKADGLAAGKGVVIAQDEAQAREALEQLLVERRFGTEQVVVEEHLDGEELSLLALCDGERAVPLASAQDYKRIFDGDQGPNTGGMGSYSPVPAIDDVSRAAEICARSTSRCSTSSRAAGSPFHGVLYAGLMMTADGPKVLEFNVRFGDPETQAMLPRLRIGPARAAGGRDRARRSRGATLEWDARDGGDRRAGERRLPGVLVDGDVITGLDRVPDGVDVTHAGTARAPDGAIVTAGGRVLSVTALGADAAAAREAAYAAADMIEFDGKQMRRDIALRVADRRVSDRVPMTAGRVRRAGGRARGDRGRRAAGRDRDGLEERPAGDGGGREGADRARDPLRGPGHVGPPRAGQGRRLRRNARMRGLRVIIAGAGLSAALPGVVAAHTDLPVIGVPLTEPHLGRRRARRAAVDRADAARRAGRLRRRRQRQQRGGARGAHPQRVVRSVRLPGGSALHGC